MAPKPLLAVESLISEIRGQRVIMDFNLAKIYGVKTKALNQAIKRQADKFPADFVFQLTFNETVELRRVRSQNVTLKRGQHRKYLPYAFTEHGAIMAANVLKSPHASRMSVFVVRAFIRMRSMLSEREELAKELAALENKLTQRLGEHESAIVDILRRVIRLL